jgi:hypothetical protein
MLYVRFENCDILIFGCSAAFDICSCVRSCALSSIQLLVQMFSIVTVFMRMCFADLRSDPPHTLTGIHTQLTLAGYLGSLCRLAMQQALVRRRTHVHPLTLMRTQPHTHTAS